MFIYILTNKIKKSQPIHYLNESVGFWIVKQNLELIFYVIS